MIQTREGKSGRYLRLAYESIRTHSPSGDNFKHISDQLMSSDSDLSKALNNLQFGPNEKRDVNGLHYYHLDGYFTLFRKEEQTFFSLQRIFYDLASIDFVVYIEPEGYFHRAAFIHANGNNKREVKDAIANIGDTYKYIAEVLKTAQLLITVQNKRGEILETASESILKGNKQKMEELENILEPVNP